MFVAGFLLLLSVLIPQTNWTLHFADSEQAGFPATNTFDGNASTIWHTQFSPTLVPPPHEIQINLGASYSVDGFRYLPRQDTDTSRRIGNFEFYVSPDGTNWGTPVITGTFTTAITEFEVLFPPKTGQYVRLRALTTLGGQAVSVAELNVLGGSVLLTPIAPGNLILNIPSQITRSPFCEGSGLQLAAGSPAIDMGEIIPGFHCPVAGPGDGTCVEWCGAAPDAGACEFCP